MKRYIFILLLFFLFLFLDKNISYGYSDCSYNLIVPREVSLNNLKEYLNDYNFNEVVRICSYDRCFDVTNSDIDSIIYDFKLKYNKTLSEDEYLDYYYKGYPITKIYVNSC